VTRVAEGNKSASSSSSHRRDGRLLCGQCELKSAHVVSIFTMFTSSVDTVMPMFDNHFTTESLLAGCPLIFFSPIHFFKKKIKRKDQNLTCWTPSHTVFLRSLLCLIPSASIVVQFLIHSVCSLHSSCPSHLSVLFLITKLDGSSPNSP